MGKRERHIKKFLFGLLLAALFLPLLQFKFLLFKETPLKGAFVKKEKVWFSAKEWLSGAYQDSTVNWFNQEFGFRSDFVRVRNQAYWYICHEAHANGIVIGKEDYLHDYNYINAYTGKDFRGEEHWKELSKRFKNLQDTFASRGVTMIIALAPGKACFFSEFIPDRFGKEGEKTNYKSASSEFKAAGINTIDFYKWFLQMKPASVYPLYPKGGIHWSVYGSALAADSLIKYVRQKSGIDLPAMKIKKVNWSDTITEQDNDIGVTMNLLFPLKQNRMAYPEIEFENDSAKTKPGMFAVGDSYFWQIYGQNLAKNVFDHIQFSYYNREVHDSRYQFIWEYKPSSESGINTAENKIFLFLVTEVNLKEFPWGFLDKAEKELYRIKK